LRLKNGGDKYVGGRYEEKREERTGWGLESQPRGRERESRSTLPQTSIISFSKREEVKGGRSRATRKEKVERGEEKEKNERKELPPSRGKIERRDPFFEKLDTEM